MKLEDIDISIGIDIDKETFEEYKRLCELFEIPYSDPIKSGIESFIIDVDLFQEADPKEYKRLVKKWERKNGKKWEE